MQSWPALKYPAMAMASAAAATSTSSKTMTGALPPSSRCTLLRVLDGRPATSMPARTEPVTDTIAGMGCVHQRATGVAIATHDVEDSRGEHLGHELGHSKLDAGVESPGLRTIVLPAAIAGAHFQTAIIMG